MGCSNTKKQTQSCQLQSNFWLQLHHNSTTAMSLPAPLQTPLLWACFCEARTHNNHLQNSPVYFKPTHSLHAEGLSQTWAPRGNLDSHREPASPPAPCCNTLGTHTSTQIRISDPLLQHSVACSAVQTRSTHPKPQFQMA